jgi:uncharacterized membrane protein
MALARRLVDAMLVALAALVVGAAATGLTDIHTFARPLAALLLARVFFWKHSPSPAWEWMVRALADASRRRHLAIWLLAGVFAVLTVAHVLRHWAVLTDAFDMVPVHQTLFYPWNGGLLRCDICYNGSYIAEHVVYSFLWLTPITSWIHSDELVFAIQALLIAVPIFLVMRRGPLSGQHALWLTAVLVIIAHRSVRGAVVWDLREDEIAFAALTGCLIAIYRSRPVIYLLCLVTALLAKENVPLIALFMAAPILWSPGLAWSTNERRALALATIALSAAWLVVSFSFILPYYAGATKPVILGRLEGFGSTPSEILVTVLTSPRAWWQIFSTKLLTVDAARYLLYLLGPFIFFYRRREVFLWLVPALPGVLMNLASDLALQRALVTHYDLTILPFLIFAFASGLEQLRPSPRQLAAGLVVASCVAGASPIAGIRVSAAYLPGSFSESRFLRAFPADVMVAAADAPIAQLTHLKRMRQLIVPKDDPTAVFSWDAFLSMNTTDRTGIPGHGALEADRVVIDRTLEWQQQLEGEMRRRGWVQESESPQRRFVLLKRPG